jgi:hypothetical protein
MKGDRLPRSMDFMMNVGESMGALRYGKSVLIYLTIFHWLQLLTIQ